jgi:hypothetical protein
VSRTPRETMCAILFNFGLTFSCTWYFILKIPVYAGRWALECLFLSDIRHINILHQFLCVNLDLRCFNPESRTELAGRLAVVASIPDSLRCRSHELKVFFSKVSWMRVNLGSLVGLHVMLHVALVRLRTFLIVRAEEPHETKHSASGSKVSHGEHSEPIES